MSTNKTAGHECQHMEQFGGACKNCGTMRWPVTRPIRWEGTTRFESLAASISKITFDRTEGEDVGAIASAA